MEAEPQEVLATPDGSNPANFEPPIGDRPSLLSPRQFQVLDELSHGFTLNEVAEKLAISRGTTQKYKTAVLARLDAHSVIQAVNIGFERGILTPDNDKDPDAPTPKITPVQLDELAYAAHGLIDVAAAAARGVGEGTVNSNRIRLKQKLDAKNLAHAVRLGWEAGILTASDPPDVSTEAATTSQPAHSLTAFEAQVFDHASHGLHLDQSALKLGISRNTVAKYRRSIKSKLHAGTMAQAVDIGFELGLLKTGAEKSKELRRVRFTEVQVEELRLAASGLNHVAAARARNVSKWTTSENRAILRKKLDATNITHVIRLAREAGIPTRPTPTTIIPTTSPRHPEPHHVTPTTNPRHPDHQPSSSRPPTLVIPTVVEGSEP